MSLSNRLTKTSSVFKQIGFLAILFVLFSVFASLDCLEFKTSVRSYFMNFYNPGPLVSGKTVDSCFATVFVPIIGSVLFLYFVGCFLLIRNDSNKPKYVNLLSMGALAVLFFLYLAQLYVISLRLSAYDPNLTPLGILAMVFIGINLFIILCFEALHIVLYKLNKNVEIIPEEVPHVKNMKKVRKESIESAEALLNLKKLLDAGVISKEEYEEKRKKYLDTL